MRSRLLAAIFLAVTVHGDSPDSRGKVRENGTVPLALPKGTGPCSRLARGRRRSINRPQNGPVPRERLLLALVAHADRAVSDATAAEGTRHGETLVRPPTANGAPASPRDLSALIAPIVERHDLPGMVAAVIEGEEVVGLGAAGVRRKGSPEKVTVDDRFHIGSCTKSMTATLCAMLVEEGKLSWETTLGAAFPELAESMRPEYRAVTLEQLLAHRAGMPGNVDRGVLYWQLRRLVATPTEDRQSLLEGTVAKPPASEPGTKFLYSNTGYVAAGHMAERATGKAWEDLMRARVFDPLGMTTAGFGAPGRPDVVDQPCGHGASGHPVEPGPLADNPPVIGPAGTVHCSIRDWAKYIALHLRGAQGDAKRLEPATFTRLHTPVGDEPPRCALGWGVAQRDWGGGDVLTHAGSNTMWFAVTWVAPRRDFAVLVASNQGGDAAEKACDEAAAALIRDRSARQQASR